MTNIVLSQPERNEFISEVNGKVEFIDKFKDTSYGIIALKYGFSLEASKQAGVLKDEVLV